MVKPQFSEALPPLLPTPREDIRAGTVRVTIGQRRPAVVQMCGV